MSQETCPFPLFTVSPTVNRGGEKTNLCTRVAGVFSLIKENISVWSGAKENTGRRHWFIDFSFKPKDE